ncbi:MAG: response regulator [Candidatus Omnitrophica bacterium]|nr:response regulator [Candidatus Omnitrophota bacterium]
MPKKILVTDDSPTIVAMIKELLESNGYAVVTAVDGQEALDKAKQEKPDLIVLDLMLPKIDGYKVCAMLKFDKNYSKIPIIILTARAGESDKELGTEVRADAYVTKPFEPNAFLSKVKEFIK